jgi:hypothetical protein
MVGAPTLPKGESHERKKRTDEEDRSIARVSQSRKDKLSREVEHSCTQRDLLQSSDSYSQQLLRGGVIMLGVFIANCVFFGLLFLYFGPIKNKIDNMKR